jgi:hypothetical protein
MALDTSARAQLTSQVTIILSTASKAGKPNLAPIAPYWLKDDQTIILGEIKLVTGTGEDWDSKVWASA